MTGLKDTRNALCIFHDDEAQDPGENPRVRARALEGLHLATVSRHRPGRLPPMPSADGKAWCGWGGTDAMPALNCHSALLLRMHL
eukprot:CAMPEP_0197874066 /NCGR_PEP_ID=MMETSP1439-20131203/3694_1 /TAXON_ID=66791 /ORGANISM="Gonyaulax spinifera, Strain CCMP409" /LENGTH=84 /DNA_ID=CAMNT_0043493149 /DNA_START=126 /DNA_END=380 /DNA_ORIENTATION=+